MPAEERGESGRSSTGSGRGRGTHRGGEAAVVWLAELLPEAVVGKGHALHECYGGELDAADDVAEGPDVRHARAQVLIHLDAAFVVHLDACVLHAHPPLLCNT